MTKEEAIQQKYMEFQYFQQQIEQVNHHLEMLAEQNAEIDLSISAVQELEKTKVDNEVLAPIANGIFLKAGLKDNQKLIVNVGSNTTVEKTIPETVKLLEKQKEEINKNIFEADNFLQQISAQAMKIFQQVEELQK